MLPTSSPAPPARRVLLKKLGKRDTTTKLKGLAELQSTLQEKGSDGGGGEWPPPGDHAARVRPPGAQVGCRARLSRGRGRQAGRGARGGTRVGVCAHTHTCPGCRGGPRVFI